MLGDAAETRLLLPLLGRHARVEVDGEVHQGHDQILDHRAQLVRPLQVHQVLEALAARQHALRATLQDVRGRAGHGRGRKEEDLVAIVDLVVLREDVQARALRLARDLLAQAKGQLQPRHLEELQQVLLPARQLMELAAVSPHLEQRGAVHLHDLIPLVAPLVRLDLLVLLAFLAPGQLQHDRLGLGRHLLALPRLQVVSLKVDGHRRHLVRALGESPRHLRLAVHLHAPRVQHDLARIARDRDRIRARQEVLEVLDLLHTVGVGLDGQPKAAQLQAEQLPRLPLLRVVEGLEHVFAGRVHGRVEGAILHTQHRGNIRRQYRTHHTGTGRAHRPRLLAIEEFGTPEVPAHLRPVTTVVHIPVHVKRHRLCLRACLVTSGL